MSVECGVLLGELIMDGAIGGAVEVLDVGLVDRGSREADEGACAEGDGGEVGRSKLEVCFHGAARVSSQRGLRGV